MNYGGRSCFYTCLSFCPQLGVRVWSEGRGVWSGWGVYGLVWGGADPPPRPEMATAAVGKHPTGMHSCYNIVLHRRVNVHGAFIAPIHMNSFTVKI